MKIRVIKKMMAYLLVGAMVLSTPMTASATEPSIADVYTDTDDGGGSGSGTLSGSNTNTGILDKELNDPDVQAQVIGLALDKTSLSLEKNGAVESDRLQARVLFTDYSPENEEMVLAADKDTQEIVNNFLRWRVIDDKGNIVNNVVGLSYYEKPDNGGKDYSRVNVNAKHGGTVQVQAYIDYNNNKQLDTDEFHAEATVSVKEFANDFTWDVPAGEKFFMNWEYDLNDYIKLDPETASDDVSFYAVTNAKKVTISDSGIMKVKKVSKGDTIEVGATIENGVNHKTTLTLDPGSPAKKVEFEKKSETLDHGKKQEREKELKVKLTPVTSGETVTDLVKWTAKPDVVNFTDISRDNNEITAKITIKGDAVGKVKITAQATSGKKATTTVVINSTPDDIKVEPVVTWTGKKPKVEVVPLGDDGEEIPVNKNGYKFEVTTVDGETKNIKNIKVNKTSGAITVPTMLTEGTGKNKTSIKQDIAQVKVSLTKANGKKYTGNNVDKSNTITAKQANIKTINVWNTTYANADSKGTQVLDDDSKNATEPVGSSPKYKITVGSKYQYKVNAISGETNMIDPELSDAVAWTSSSAKVGTVSDGGLFTALKGGTTKIKLSYVTITNKAKCKAKLNSKTITIKPIQKATSLTLNKNVFVVVADGKEKNVAISVKKQLPSGSKDLITWKTIIGKVGDDGKTKVIDGTNTIQDPTVKKTTSVKVPVKDKGYTPGTVIKVGAFADGGAVSYAYIYIVADKTKAVRAMEGANITTADSKAKKLTKVDLVAGDSSKNSITITPQIQKTSNKDFIQATVYSKENIGYSTDPVTYSFNKAGIASINSQTGKITAMKPGTTKLTIKTLSGKKATVTIKVK